jgi:hypothetical protein
VILNSIQLDSDLAIMIISSLLNSKKENPIYKYSYDFLENLFAEILQSFKSYELNKYYTLMYEYIMKICLNKRNQIQNDIYKIV